MSVTPVQPRRLVIPKVSELLPAGHYNYGEGKPTVYAYPSRWAMLLAFLANVFQKAVNVFIGLLGVAIIVALLFGGFSLTKEVGASQVIQEIKTQEVPMTSNQL